MKTLAGRASGIELCRILAMLMIVAGHFIGQSGLGTRHSDSMWLMFFGSGARWAVNLFLVVGCWFMLDSKFKAERVARLYLTVLFYTVPLTVLAAAWWSPTTKDVFRGFFPFLGRPLWFASAYISLLLVAPWLKLTFRLSRWALGALVAVLTVVVPGICTLPDPQMCYVVDVCYFFYVFILVGFLKPLLLSSGKYRFVALAVGVAIYSALVALSQCKMQIVSSWSGQCLADFKTIPNLLSSLLVFCFFLHLDIGSIKWINIVASAAFAVYVIHQTPAFYGFLWTEVFMAKKWLMSDLYPLYTSGVVVVVYVSGLLLEIPRRMVVDKWLLSRATSRELLRRLDDIYAKTTV